MKVCIVCNKEKEYKEFRRDRKSDDGYKSICKECVQRKKEEKRKAKQKREDKIYEEAFEPMRELFKEYQKHFENNDEPLRIPKEIINQRTVEILESYGYDFFDYVHRFEMITRQLGREYGFYIHLFGRHSRDGYYLLTKIVNPEGTDVFFDQLHKRIIKEENALTFTVEELYIESAKVGTYLWDYYLEDQFREQGLKIRLFEGKAIVL